MSTLATTHARTHTPLILLVPSSTAAIVGGMQSGLAVGNLVTRGPHWIHGWHDGGPGCLGSILAVRDGLGGEKGAEVVVRWKVAHSLAHSLAP